MLLSSHLSTVVQIDANDDVLVLNSAADPFVSSLAKRTRTLTLAEDNIAIAQSVSSALNAMYGAFHDYILHSQAATMDIALMNLLYQPNNAWMLYGLHIAAYALRPGGRLYVVGAKDRGILSMARRMQEQFGNVETLAISKGHRVLCSRNSEVKQPQELSSRTLTVFADNKLDEGTRLLLDALEIHATDEALDLGCGAGFIGLHIARLARRGHVTMVDVSLAAIAAAESAVAQSGLTNIRVLPGDGVQAVLSQRFDLVATNPPFHLGGIQTTAIAERFIRDAAQVLRPRGRFYLVANRFLKYEPTLKACFREVEEVGGDTRYKVLRACRPGRSYEK